MTLLLLMYKLSDLIPQAFPRHFGSSAVVVRGSQLTAELDDCVVALLPKASELVVEISLESSKIPPLFSPYSLKYRRSDVRRLPIGSYRVDVLCVECCVIVYLL